jgi:hypothetical protein
MKGRILLSVGQDCDRIGELVDEAIHQDNMAKVRTKLLKPAEVLPLHKSGEQKNTGNRKSRKDSRKVTDEFCE